MDTRLTAPRKEKDLETTIRKEIEALRHMTVAQLKKKYAEVFGEETRSHHKHFLFRRIAWRIQALAINAGAIIDHEAPRERRFVAVQK